MLSDRERVIMIFYLFYLCDSIPTHPHFCRLNCGDNLFANFYFGGQFCCRAHTRVRQKIVMCNLNKIKRGIEKKCVKSSLTRDRHTEWVSSATVFYLLVRSPNFFVFLWPNLHFKLSRRREIFLHMIPAKCHFHNWNQSERHKIKMISQISCVFETLQNFSTQNHHLR